MDENLGNLSKKELLAIAKDKGLKGVGAWTKDQLVNRLKQLVKPMVRPKARADGAAKTPEPVKAKVPVASAEPVKAKVPVASAEPVKAKVPVASAEPVNKTEPGNHVEPAEVVANVPPQVVLPRSLAAEALATKGESKADIEPVDAVFEVPGSLDVKKPRPPFKATTQVEELLEVDQDLGDLPPGYDEDRAVLLVRDPYWVFLYWDLSRFTLEAAESRGDYRQILRVQELGGFGQDDPASFYDVPVPKAARTWYLRLPGDGRRYRVEVALQHRDGGYTQVAQTNSVEVPRSEPSEVVADRFVTLPGGEDHLKDRPHSALPPVAQWDIVIAPLTSEAPPPIEPSFAAAPLGTHKPAFGPRLSGPWSAEMPWALRPESQAPGGPLPDTLGSQNVGSWSFGASENRFGDKKKDFWLVADAELIVYGATEPDARVTLRGEKVDLRPDGTFSFRFYLPDGDHPIPISAVNSDGDDERRITLSVSRVTTGDPRVNLLARTQNAR